MFRGGANHAHNASNSEAVAKNLQAWITWMGSLAEKGILIGADPFQPIGKQVSGTGKIVSDGAYEAAGEQVGGYLLIHANDIDEAVEISKGCPIFNEDGKVEIRPIQNMVM